MCSLDRSVALPEGYNLSWGHFRQIRVFGDPLGMEAPLVAGTCCMGVSHHSAFIDARSSPWKRLVRSVHTIQGVLGPSRKS